DAEDLSGLVEDQADRLTDLEALVDRAPGLVERVGLACPALALLEEPSILDGDAGLIGEALEQHLMPRAEEPGRGGERGDGPDDLAGDLQRNGEQRADALGSVLLPPGRTRVLLEIVRADRSARCDGAPDDPLPDGHAERGPLGGLEPVGGDVVDR